MIDFPSHVEADAVNNLVPNAINTRQRARTAFVITRINGKNNPRCVRDEGVGIPEADQPRLFEAFHRGSNVGTISGTGLGLTITKQSIEAHGGSLSFESKLNVGTTFLATIPLHMDIKETT